MKALAVSADRQNLDEIRKLSAGLDMVTELTCHQGTLAGMQSLPVKGELDLLLLDCRHNGVAPLADLERLMAFYPNLDTILLVDHESPELLLRALRLGVREVLKAPLDRQDIQSALHRITERAKGATRGLGRVVAFMSCKGGSGATFLATNAGYAIGERLGKRALLIDLNMQFGDAVLYVSDRRPPVTLPEVTRDVQRIDMSLLEAAVVSVSPHFGVLAAPEDPTHASEIKPAHIESLIRFARANYDYVLLDVGRSLDTCSIQALDLADHIYPVLQLTLPFLRDAKRLFDVYRSLDYRAEKVRPILNRVERGQGEVTQDDADRLLAYKIFATVPNHYKSVTASVNQGIPILKLDRGSPVTRSLETLVSRMSDQPAVRSGGLLGRLLGRSQGS